MASTPVVFSSLVLEHWIPEPLDHRAQAGFQVVVDPSLQGDRSMTVLRVVNGPNRVTLTPAQADKLSLSSTGPVTAEQLADRIKEAGITFNGPDFVFYLPVAERSVVQAEPVPVGTRQLTSDDEDAFARFAGESPETDMDQAFVELDHWLVFGTLVDGRLVAAASMYPWRDTRLADLGVITLPGYRGRGLGRATVRAMSARAIEMGYEPQYRCQTDNAPSVALARAAGFVQFGEWDVSGADA